MSTGPDLVEWGRSQIGTREYPPFSNRVWYWDYIGMSALQGNAWCAAFYLAGLIATHTPPVTRSVYVYTIRDVYKMVGRFYPVSQGQPGDQVCFNIGQGHTGILVALNAAARTVTTIDGNTSPEVGGSYNGGGVYQNTRPWSQCFGVGRPYFAIVTPIPQEDDVPKPTDRMRFHRNPNGPGRYVLTADGGIQTRDGAPWPPPRYTALANDGGTYSFPADNGTVWSYPGLRPDERLGSRYFTDFEFD